MEWIAKVASSSYSSEPTLSSAIGAAIILIALFGFIGYEIWSIFYFRSEKFKEIRDSIKDNTQKCNELNEHIEELKHAYVKYHKTDYGESTYTDTSRWKFLRPALKNRSSADNVYECSRTICANADAQPFKYICKYFNIAQTEESLSEFESLLNDYSAAEQGKDLLLKERKEIIDGIKSQIPWPVRVISKNRLMWKLGFKSIDFRQIQFPVYTFQYTSSGGNSSMKSRTVMDIPMLERFITYLSELVTFRKSVAGQRALMTRSLREEIKERDKYTCRKCGNSTKKEPNLLLEIDHIKPLSKGGMTTKDNLQTLCWKCNRSKGARYEENEKSKEFLDKIATVE